VARYATYLRRSSLGEEDKNYSIDDQRDNVRAWGDSNGHTFAAEYSDPGGKSYKLNRPVFQQMLRDAKDGKFDLVVVGRWDRFSRMQDQQSRAIDQFKGYGVEVVSATQPTAPGPMGTLMRNLHGFVSESELYHIRERMLGGRRKRIYAGKILTSSYPLYGYEWGDPEKGKRSYYVEDGETAPVVRLIFALVLAGMTIRGVTVKLEKDGVPTPMQTNASRGRLPKNKPMSSIWRISTLHRILSNPAYCGRHSAWRRQNLETTTIDPATGIEVDRVQRVERPEDHEDRVWFGHDVCPPLVSEADFQTVQALLARNKQNAPRNLRDPEAGLLRGGIAVCGYCGRNMSVKFVQANGYYRYFCCSGTDVPAARALCEGAGYSWRTEELDKPAWDWVRFQFENPDLSLRSGRQTSRRVEPSSTTNSSRWMRRSHGLSGGATTSWRQWLMRRMKTTGWSISLRRSRRRKAFGCG
jgi:DNA invertase Pin-like site-specific DNA recombinase